MRKQKITLEEKLAELENEIEQLLNDSANCPDCQKHREKNVSDLEFCQYHDRELQFKFGKQFGLEEAIARHAKQKRRLLKKADKTKEEASLSNIDFAEGWVKGIEEVRRMIDEKLDG